MYFNNTEVTRWTIKYQQLITFDEDGNQEKLSPEAKHLSNKIMTETDKIIDGVINTHKLSRFEGRETVKLIAMEACFNSLAKFDPLYMKGDKKTTLFSYLSIVAKMSIHYYNIGEFKKRLDKPEIPLEELDDYIHKDDNQSFELVDSMRNKYLPILKPYLHPVFRAICDYWILDPSHPEKRNIIKYLLTRQSEFKSYFGEPVNQKLLATQYSIIIKRIRDFERGLILKGKIR